MVKFSIPNYSPAGLRGGLAAHPRDVVADAYGTIATIAEASRTAMPAPAKNDDDRYDDGLVHDHRWARSSAH